jgi:hypothetical protein
MATIPISEIDNAGRRNPSTRVRYSRAQRRVLAKLYGWRRRTENELTRLWLSHRHHEPDDPAVRRRYHELTATLDALAIEIKQLKTSPTL